MDGFTDERMRILIVEDDETLVTEMKKYLKKWGYEAAAVRDFENVRKTFVKYRPKLVLLDVNLPCYDGYYWCGRIRQISRVPIIFISSRSDDKDKIMAIAQGGDDYVDKPFRLELLKAKIEAVWRRTYDYTVKEQAYLTGKLFFDFETCRLLFGGEEIPLTKMERRIIKKLVEHRPDVVEREELMMELWNTDEYVSDSSLTTAVSRLREKLRKRCGEELIGTKKGQGYYIS